MADASGRFDFVVVANRLPVDRADPDRQEAGWRRSPGGLVSAVEPVMRRADGVWVGWPGSPGEAPEPFEADGVHVAPVGLSADDVADFYEGFSNGTLWPLYHDVIVPPQFHRRWWEAYVRVNQWFARAAAGQAAPGATVWVHDYQLQLVPALLRRERPDLRIGFFDHIPFPGYEIFAQLPWRRQIVTGLLGADLIGFQRGADATNFLRACRRAAGISTRADVLAVPVDLGPGHDGGHGPGHDGGHGPGHDGVHGAGYREVRAATFPISIDADELDRLARTPAVMARAAEIRRDLGDPATLLLGVDRLDYTKGILHRLKAYEELLDEADPALQGAVFVQVASPSRERVAEYQALRQEVEGVVGRINGQHGTIAGPAVHYLHQTYGREEMAALYLAADVMVVTPLRDGMNLVAKEYVAARHDELGALVLSEFTGAADELSGAFRVNPHDIDGMKRAIADACTVDRRQARRRMRALRRRVHSYDVAHWAASYLEALATAPRRPGRASETSPERPATTGETPEIQYGT